MMGLTGTLSNGYSASLFRLYYTLNPSVVPDSGGELTDGVLPGTWRNDFTPWVGFNSPSDTPLIFLSLAMAGA